MLPVMFYQMKRKIQAVRSGPMTDSWACRVMKSHVFLCKGCIKSKKCCLVAEEPSSMRMGVSSKCVLCSGKPTVPDSNCTSCQVASFALILYET